MRFMLAGIPVTVQPLIFLTAFAIGGRRPPAEMAVWIALVLVGVLAHELGHALLVRHYGYAPWIQLHAMGGSTGWQSTRPMPAGRRIAVSAAGPFVGIALGFALRGLWVALEPVPGTILAAALNDAIFVTLYWGLFNLVPVLPLDGGAIVTTAAEAVAGRRGRIVMLALSVALLVMLAGWAVLHRSWWLAIIGGVLAWANVQALRGTRPPAPTVPMSAPEG